MIEPQRCCAETRNDLRAAHKRVAEVELQLLLLAETIAGLNETLHAEREEHAEYTGQLLDTIDQMGRDRDKVYPELAFVTRERDNLRAMVAARNEQVADLTQRLAAVTLERDQLLRAQAATTIQEEEAA